MRERRRIGSRMRDLRRAHGLTQEQLADRIGLDNKTISRAENGRYRVPLDHLLLVARGLGIAIADLVGE